MDPVRRAAGQYSAVRGLGRIVSGGQAGVDRAALDAAIEAGVPHGGWCPAGRWAEDGPIPLRYHLRETPSPDARDRTIRNVRDSDATLILLRGAPSGGTADAIGDAARLGKPVRRVDLRSDPDPQAVREWIESVGASCLNVVGPRESESPGIYAAAHSFLRAVFSGVT
ncbi:putative molybdenum carrier protein [soil metagenome]